MVYGYARVSTAHQDTELQLLALKIVGEAQGSEYWIDRIGRNVLHAVIWLSELQETTLTFAQLLMRSICIQRQVATISETFSILLSMNQTLIAKVRLPSWLSRAKQIG